ncbi:LysE family translocator [Pricia sp.]|uniref:LysE family translocator n=1 Tax=Pricia sp. TaxID=2268138 RepID=UPI003593BAE2
MNYETLYAFSLATAALAISPGPDNLYVLTQSLANGKKYGLATTAGLISGCLVHTTLLAFGLSVIIRESDALFLGIKILGAVYLLYLAIIVYRSDSALEISGEKGPKKGLGQLFKQGFVMNVLNPKVTIFFLAFFPGFLFSDTLSTVLQFYALGLVFMFVSGVIFCGIAVLSGTISKFLVHNKNVGPVLKWLQIIVFIGIALYLLLSEK